jgi:hypothetical protein
VGGEVWEGGLGGGGEEEGMARAGGGGPGARARGRELDKETYIVWGITNTSKR